MFTTPVKTLVSCPGVRVACAACGEEITQRARGAGGRAPCLCKACAGEGHIIS